MTWQDESDTVQFAEPILPKKDCRVRIDFAESVDWTVKAANKGGAPGHEGEVYHAMKLTVVITDPNIQIEHEGGKPRLSLEHQINLDKYPFLSKKTGTVEWMGRNGLYELEEALGFDPVFVDGAGASVEPFLTRSGRKVAPKVEGVKRQVNLDFASSYFHPDGSVNPDNWINKIVYADIEVEKSEQYGDRNRIARFKRAPASV